MRPDPAMEVFGRAWAVMPGAAPAVCVHIEVDALLPLCASIHEAGGRLVSLWGETGVRAAEPSRLCVVLDVSSRLHLIETTLPAGSLDYPDLSELFPSALRMQRATGDLTGLQASAEDSRPWLSHGVWSGSAHPLRSAAPSAESASGSESASTGRPYDFVRVRGEGVHEIPVGPVHAGIIEPGHFRFSVVGEKVLRLEARLGYVHKGIEKRFVGMDLADGVRLAARVSGDSAVAFAWAYAMAAEALTGTRVPPRALGLRALLLERERIANHLGDLGALGNDAGFAFALAQFSRLKEDLLRDNDLVWGVRYPMDAIVVGGVTADVGDSDVDMLLASMRRLEAEVTVLQNILNEHAGVQDRFMGAGRLDPQLAKRIGVVGLAARACGQVQDWRASLRIPPFDALEVLPALRREGDVAARVGVRFAEIRTSLEICRVLLDTMPAGPVFGVVGKPRAEQPALGAVEGWRGPVLVALRTDATGRVARCHPHDPSWHNWPALEHAVLDNIVPDFPLINKSFNLSYSGCDL